MEFEWDKNKNERNIEVHGFDFNDAIQVFYHWHVIARSPQVHGETRELAIGLIEDLEVAVVHTWRGDNIRIISLRRARTYERKIYWDNLPNGLEAG
jgi:uncharacterized protein